MKRLGLFILGFTIELLAVFVIFYALGYVMEYFDIQLYMSESGQQKAKAMPGTDKR